MVVKADGRWKITMEGKRVILLNFPFQNQTISIYFSMHVGIHNEDAKCWAVNTTDSSTLVLVHCTPKLEKKLKGDEDYNTI